MANLLCYGLLLFIGIGVLYTVVQAATLSALRESEIIYHQGKEKKI